MVVLRNELFNQEWTPGAVTRGPPSIYVYCNASRKRHTSSSRGAYNHITRGYNFQRITMTRCKNRRYPPLVARHSKTKFLLGSPESTPEIFLVAHPFTVFSLPLSPFHTSLPRLISICAIRRFGEASLRLGKKRAFSPLTRVVKSIIFKRDRNRVVDK